MNILPKKSWHVRTKRNIERVRKDEEKAAEEEKEKQRRIAIAEQEARTAILRERAEERSISNGGSNKDTLVEVQQSKTHINFFSEEEQNEGRTVSGGNADYEQEKKEEKEKHERAIGLLKYLGEGSAESQIDKPWYFHVPKKDKKTEDESSRRKEEEFDRKKKSFMDPMRHMTTYLEKKRKIDDLDEDRERKHKRKHKDKKSEKKVKLNGPKSIEQLRAERIAREKAEKLRSEGLLAKLRGENTEEKRSEDYDDRTRRYNSQFNPDLARRHQSRYSNR